ncbi:MAG: chromate transporter [Burkholderiaceae bacterium]
MVFSGIALSGFGGVLPFAYRSLVEKLRWLSDQEFSEHLALGQILPGPTICNMAVLIGWERAGLMGAGAASLGMLLGPMLLVIALGLAYAHYSSHPVVAHALNGMAASAAGLILATALKMAIGLLRADARRARVVLLSAFGLAAFIGVAVLRWPLIVVALVLAPLSILAFRALRRPA